MPRPPVKKSLRFPFAGVVRRKGFREAQQSPPYGCVDAVNVRGKDTSGREMGGSRPGMSKVVANAFGAVTGLGTVTWLNSSGVRVHSLVVIGGGQFHVVEGSVVATTNANLLTDSGLGILTEDGDQIVFDGAVAASNPVGSTGAYSMAELNGRLLLADSVLREYNPANGLVAPVSGAPAAQPLVCVYRGRVVLSGANHLWYASRQADSTDWNFNADMQDVGRAVAGQLSHAGSIGAIPQALIPVNDQILVFACANSLWQLRGDPAKGNLSVVSSEIGIVAPGAWAKAPDGLMAFLSNDGVYVWMAGSSEPPQRFSEERLPNELRNPSTLRKTTMAYDPVGRGFHLFSTPTTGDGSHWWLDIGAKAMWPVVFGANTLQPVAVTRLEGSGLAEIVLGCADGYLRKFNPSVVTDDGTALSSHVLIGPVFLPPDDTRDAVFNEIHGILREGSATWRLFVDSTAEGASANARTAMTAVLAGSSPVGVSGSGAWVAGRNKVERPRARGSWAVVMVSATGKWVYEALAITALQLGRNR